jgi:PHD/YefM family antitoxin component YafN of YafNO toxin-antitoxin module
VLGINGVIKNTNKIFYINHTRQKKAAVFENIEEAKKYVLIKNNLN